MSEKPFRLYVYPRPQGAYGLTLSQEMVKGTPNGNGSSAGWRRLVRVYGLPLQAVAEDIFAILKQAGYRPNDLKRERRTPLELAEENGVRLGLLFMMVKPLSKGERITSIPTASKPCRWRRPITGSASAPIPKSGNVPGGPCASCWRESEPP